MLLKIPNVKKININNKYSCIKGIKLDQYNNYNPKKNKSKIKQKKFILNPSNYNTKEQIINKKSNTSMNNNNNDNSFNQIGESAKKKKSNNSNIITENNNPQINVKIIKESKMMVEKNNYSFNNKHIKFFRNNHSQKNNNSFYKTNYDYVKPRYNQYSTIYNNNYIRNYKNMKSLNSSKITKNKNPDNNEFNNSKNNSNGKNNKIKNIKNIKKQNIFNKQIQKSKTPIITTRVTENNSKSKSNKKCISHNNSLEKTYNNRNNHQLKINLLSSGKNINVKNFIRNNINMKNNIRTKFFQANNIFAEFKPKKKKKNINRQEELLQLKQNSFIMDFFNLNKKNIFQEENIKNNKNNRNINLNRTTNTNTNNDIETYQTKMQKETEKRLNNEESIKDILPLTSNSTNLNILTSSNTQRQSKSNILTKTSSLQQKLNNINNLNNNISNDYSNSQSPNLKVNSAISLSSYPNITMNLNNKNISTINSNKNAIFKGKKIKCIHDISKTGLSGDEKKVNQDRYFIFNNFVEGFDNIFMGVCDGHGYFGQEISEYIKENLPMDLNRLIKTRKLDLNKDDLSDTIISTFLMENNTLLRNKQIDSDLSGSTCLGVIYTPQKLIIANVGDSRCVLGSCSNEGEWKFENLSNDHKPDVKEEADRIKKSGGRIKAMVDEDGSFIGPLRVYLKDKELPGLAMTRSFGDYFATIAGTIAVPEIKEHILVPEDKFIILATDGLYEFINSEEVGNIIKKYYEKNDIVGCCEYLYKESYRKWIAEEEDTVDDITIILVFFED